MLHVYDFYVLCVQLTIVLDLKQILTKYMYRNNTRGPVN